MYTLHLYVTNGWLDDITVLPVIATIDRKPDLYDLYRINGEVYSVCRADWANNAAAVRKLKWSEEPEATWEHEWTCPFCGYVDSDSFELSDEDDNYECPRCGSLVSFQREITVEYIVTPIQAQPIIDL